MEGGTQGTKAGSKGKEMAQEARGEGWAKVEVSAGGAKTGLEKANLSMYRKGEARRRSESGRRTGRRLFRASRR